MSTATGIKFKSAFLHSYKWVVNFSRSLLCICQTEHWRKNLWMDKMTMKKYIYQIQGNWADRNFITSLCVNSLLITHAEIQFIFSLVHTAREKLSIGRKFMRWGVPLTWNYLSSTKIKGVLTRQRGDLRDGATSLLFPLVALHLFTWYHHKLSCRRESPRREFTPVDVPGREFHSSTKSLKGIM